MLLLHSVRFFSIRTYWIWSFQWIKKKKRKRNQTDPVHYESQPVTVVTSSLELTVICITYTMILLLCWSFKVSVFMGTDCIEKVDQYNSSFLCYTEEIKSHRFGLLWYDYRANAALCSMSMLGKMYCEKEREVNFLQKAKPEQYFITFNFINLEPQSYVIKHLDRFKKKKKK